jgi:hypothetical protein
MKPIALVERVLGFSTSTLLLKASAVGAYVALGIALGVADGDGEAKGVAEVATGDDPPHVTIASARASGTMWRIDVPPIQLS